MSPRPSYPKKTEYSGEVLLMAKLGSLAVIYKKCLYPTCDKKTDAKFDGLFLCSVEHWILFKELSTEINSQYGWDN